MSIPVLVLTVTGRRGHPPIEDREQIVFGREQWQQMVEWVEYMKARNPEWMT